jgi:prepilin-type N-terminal cleavage/methylation domain-containing protein
MPARIRKAQEQERGFTLIELLVVMIIIGILAAIAIPVFLNQRKKAQDSAAKADVTTLGKEIATYFVDTCQPPVVAVAGGRYTLSAPVAVAPCTTPAAAVGPVDLGNASANVVVVNQNLLDDTHWCIDVHNGKGDHQDFKYSAKGGLQTGPCGVADVA